MVAILFLNVLYESIYVSSYCLPIHKTNFIDSALGFASSPVSFKILVNIPVERAKDAVCFLQRCGLSLVSSAIIRRVLFAAVWSQPGVVWYHI